MILQTSLYILHWLAFLQFHPPFENSSEMSLRSSSLCCRYGVRVNLYPFSFSIQTSNIIFQNNIMIRNHFISTDISNMNVVNSSSTNPPSPPSFPPYSRLLPCPSFNHAPRIEHMIVSEGGFVLECISKTLRLPSMFVADLIRFGAVFCALICPKPPPTATQEQVRLYKRVTAQSVLKKRHKIRGQTMREAQKTFRISSGNEFVEAGTYLRIHVHPKRFPRCYEIDWKSRIIVVTDSYVVLDKPAGMPVGGTTDNIEECCVTFVSRALGLTTQLRITHQIDNCTEGCVVLARTSEYSSYFTKMIRAKRVNKIYTVLLPSPVAIGKITHYMCPINGAPRLLSEDFVEGWQLCELEVLECKKIMWTDIADEAKCQVEVNRWPMTDYAFECNIKLFTGRTHQIRAQLAACGSPVIGDTMYTPAAAEEVANPGVNPFGRQKNRFPSEELKASAAHEWTVLHGKEPEVRICLQASHISWCDTASHLYNAGRPWWWCNNEEN